MNKKIVSLVYTIIIYAVLIIFFFLVSVNLKYPGEEFVTLGFQTIEDIEEMGALAKIGGTEDIFSLEGDIPVSTGRIKKSLSPLEKPPYEGGETESGEREGYRLAGELSKRKIIHFKKPEYPENESENTQVNLEIEANPDGTIKTVRIVKTGGLSFDNIAMEAVREWRFQPLAPNVKQTIQTGIVTIYFEIK
ncbi:TonB family protein [candidate division WOR-3 bacterium]|nr:TonB family protein [candidate division WOR-3 bacterium]